MSILTNLIEKPVNDLLDTVAKQAPPTIDKTLTSAATALTGSIEQAVALFRRLYTEGTGRVAAWLPTRGPFLATKVAELVKWAKAAAKKYL